MSAPRTAATTQARKLTGNSRKNAAASDQDTTYLSVAALTLQNYGLFDLPVRNSSGQLPDCSHNKNSTEKKKKKTELLSGSSGQFERTNWGDV